ncbi:apoptosis regulatory protein siva-like [Nannochloropsis oceanica]
MWPSSWWSRRDENNAASAASSSGAAAAGAMTADPLKSRSVGFGVNVGSKREALGVLQPSSLPSIPHGAAISEEGGGGDSMLPSSRPWKMARVQLSQPPSQYIGQVQEPLICVTTIGPPVVGMEEEAMEKNYHNTTRQQPQQPQGPAQHSPPTLAGQSRRQTAAYGGVTNALLQLRSPSTAAASKAGTMRQQQQQLQQKTLQKDCDICLLSSSSSQSSNGSQSSRDGSNQQHGMMRTSRHPQEIAAMALWARGPQRAMTMSQSPPHAQQQQQQQQQGSGHSDCWISIGRCRHCERGVCKTCLRDCEACRETFCSLCSTVDYGGAFEKVVCIDCGKRLAITAAAAAAAAVPRGGQEMDLS